MDRRAFLKSSAAAALVAGFGPDFWRRAYSLPAVAGTGPYGPRGRPDENGLRLPPGFTSRIVARSGHRPVDGSDYRWHAAPDGGACFAAPDGGWVYVSNSEVGKDEGGVGALRFAADGRITDAYPILAGTSTNCSGGPTPWGTWLSCEETADGKVYECDPFTRRTRRDKPEQRRAALGRFSHEAVTVDPDRGRLYLTEDTGDGRLYRFTPSAYPDLSEGRLEAAFRRRDPGDDQRGTISWVPAEADRPARGRDSSVFDGGEGIWYDDGWLFFSTKGDNRVWALEIDSGRYEVIFSPRLVGRDILSGVDNLFVSPFSGDLYVAEDSGTMDLVLLAAPLGSDAPRVVSKFLTIPGHDGSEITGPAMSPDGSRLYVSSQRGATNTDQGGVTYEITGPFRTTRPGGGSGSNLPVVAAVAATAAVLAAGAVAVRRRPGPADGAGSPGSGPDAGV